MRFAYPGATEVFTEPGLTLRLEGGSVALVGENGAGKTTLTKLLNGLLRPDAGTVTVGGVAVAQRSVAQMAAVVGYAFQNPDDQLFERTVRAEVAFGPKAMKRPPREVDRAVERALAACDLSDRADTHPHDLGLPERKWVAIASAIAAEAPIVVLDEPTLGQDAAARARLRELVREVTAGGALVIVVSHDMDFVAESCATVVMLAHGKVLYQGPVEQAFEDGALCAAAGIEAPHVTQLARALGARPAPVREADFIAWWRERAAARDRPAGLTGIDGG